MYGEVMTTTTTATHLPQAGSAACCAPAGAADPDAPPSDACCLGRDPLGRSDAERLSVKLKALADPSRLQLLSHLASRGCGEVCSCDLGADVGLSQPTVSHHLKKLVEAGLLTREQSGRWAHYSVVPGSLDELRDLFDLR